VQEWLKYEAVGWGPYNKTRIGAHRHIDTSMHAYKGDKLC